MRWKIGAPILALFVALGVAVPLAACDPTPAPCIYACWLAQPGNVWTPPTTTPPVIVPVYVPPPVPIVTPPPPQPALANYWDPTKANGCISLPLAQEWANDVASTSNVWVFLYHGTNDNGTQIATSGLTLYMDDADVPGATYVSRDYNAAHDAAYNPNHYVPFGKSFDPWIVGSKIPYAVWQHYFEPYERPYKGFAPSTLQSTETLLGVTSLTDMTYDTVLGNTQLMFFNYGIYNWGYSL